MDPRALRFLANCTFGPTLAEYQRLQTMDVAAWLTWQMQLPPSLHRTAMQTLGNDQRHRQATWWRLSLTAPDQLRQRVAWALSQILVISDAQENLHGDPYGCAHFYDVLVANAFGSYRDLLLAVALHPMMGRYLSHLRNARADTATGTRPDENFARELMQLFTIGNWRLHPTGTQYLPPTPTYTQQDITEMARVWTGWNYAGALTWWDYTANHSPMQPNEVFHDQGSKLILGRTFAANQGARRDIEQAIDLLVRHANCAPFLSRQLIQRLTVSRPSGNYVRRVADVWTASNGHLGQVITAILLDPEAQTPGTKMREPILMQTALWRALGSTSVTGEYRFYYAEHAFRQAPLRSPTVFNFYRPESLPAPEAELLDHATLLSVVNHWYKSVYEPEDIRTQQAWLLPLAGSPEVLVEAMNLALRHGSMLAEERNLILAHLRQVQDPAVRVGDAIWLTLSSPHAVVG